MRICSLLPGATEIVFSLGLGDHLVGVTHECDHPADAKNKPVMVHSAIDPARMSSGEIDLKVGELLRDGKGLYTIDERAFREAAPDLILTQGLCDVCALDYNDVVKAADLLPHRPQILSLNPRILTDILDDVRRIGAASGRSQTAEQLVRDYSHRIEQIGYEAPSYRPRVVCLEWFDPLYTAGHWVPEMVALAGGYDVLAHAGEPSSRVEWEQVIDAKPEILLLMPCGFDTRRAVKESAPLRALRGWNDLPAVKAGNVYALNGNAYFSRPGPRLVNGLEILARIIHPDTDPSEISPADTAKLN
ncbi:MAG TPA: cobalamin-binding protein [Candidatus Limnocylindria bacterium]|nr:cobalamin-binding protein [Candidatus Limnocylindria bacterium]